MADVSEMRVKTFFPRYQFSFKWTMENFSELPDHWSKRSDEFSVEPESRWYVEFKKEQALTYLFLCRNDTKHFKVSCETLTLNCKDEILHKISTSYENSVRYNLLPGKFYIGVLNNLPEDKVTINILIKVRNSEPSTVYVNLPPSATEASGNRLKTLSGDLKKLIDNDIETDVTFNIGGETLSAHKNILVSRSEVFARMFQEGMTEGDSNVVDIEDVDLSTMKILLSFLYSAELEECDLDTALEVYRAADKYAVPDLRDACAHTLTSLMTMDSACKILYVADMHHHLELKDKAIRFITVHHKPNQTDLHEKS